MTPTLTLTRQLLLHTHTYKHTDAHTLLTNMLSFLSAYACTYTHIHTLIHVHEYCTICTTERRKKTVTKKSKALTLQNITSSANNNNVKIPFHKIQSDTPTENAPTCFIAFGTALYIHICIYICVDTCTRGQFVNALRRNCCYAYCNFRTWTSTRTTFSLFSWLFCCMYFPSWNRLVWSYFIKLSSK